MCGRLYQDLFNKKNTTAMAFQEYEDEQKTRKVIRQEISRANSRRLEDEASDKRLSQAIAEIEANRQYWVDQNKGKWRSR